MNLKDKKILFIVAFCDFRDSEYFIPREILEKEGAEIKTASDEVGLAVGADGGEVNIDIKLENVSVSDFDPHTKRGLVAPGDQVNEVSPRSGVGVDAVIFIGGPGALKHLDNEKSYKIANEVVAQDKILAAICVAPAILAKAGVLAGKKATVWTSQFDKSNRDTLIENGADYQSEHAVQDGKIITADGPSSAEEFGKKIADALR